MMRLLYFMDKLMTRSLNSNSEFISSMRSIICILRAIVRSLLVVLGEYHFPFIIGDAPLDHVTKDDGPVAARPRTNCAVAGPRNVEDRPLVGFVERLCPSSLIAEPQHVVGSYGKVIAVRAPCDRSYHVVIRSGSEEEAPVGVEDLVFTVLSAG